MKRARGFTLLEVLIAIAIIAGAMLVLTNSWSTNLLRVRKSSLYNNVATLLERKMVETEAQYKDKPLGDIPETDGGDFGSDFPLYSWKMKSKDMKFPDISAIMIGSGQGDETLLSMIRQMTDMISKSMKEVRVSIIVKTKRKPLTFSATTYFVNYDQGLAGLPGAAGGLGGASGGGNPSGSGTQTQTGGGGQ